MSEGISGGTMAGGKSGMVTLPAYILEDSPRLAKRLDDLRQAEERAKEAIALIGEASQIEQLRAQAAAERDEQDRLTAETRKHCEKITADAKREAADRVAKAQEEAAVLLESAHAQTVTAEEARVQASKVIAEAAQTHTDLQGREVSLLQERESLNKLQLDLHEREQLLLDEKSKLATVREQIDTILG
jgi:chromosome segregation ATPase